MGLNLSSKQIAQELDLDKDHVYQMVSQLRTGIVASKPEVTLSGEVECDEVYVTAGQQGNPEAVKKKVVRGGETVSKGFGVGVPKRRKNHRFLG